MRGLKKNLKVERKILKRRKIVKEVKKMIKKVFYVEKLNN